MIAKQITLILFLTLIVGQSRSIIVVQVDNSTQIELVSTEIIYVGSHNDRIQDPVTFEITTETSAEKVRGRMYVNSNSLPIDEIIIDVQNKGAAAILYLSQQYRVAGYLKHRVNHKELIPNITIPIFELGLIEATAFLSLNGITNVTLVPSDEANQWELVFTSSGYYAFLVFLGIFPATNLALAIWKAKIFRDYYGGIKTSVVFYVLFLEMISNAIRIVLDVDPLCGNFIYPEQVSIAFTELSLPFALSAILLFVLYWHEMMTRSAVVVHPFITKLRIPFFILSGCLLCIQLIRIFLRSFTQIPRLQFITAIVYMIVVTGVSTFYIITGTKLLIRLNESKNLGRNVKLRRASVKMMIGACFLLSFIVFAILFASGIAYYPIPSTYLPHPPSKLRSHNSDRLYYTAYFLVWCFLWTVINAVSLMNILAFETPSGKSSQGSSQPTDRSRAASTTTV